MSAQGSCWFVCKYCSRAFQRGEDLVLHKKENHREQLLLEKKAKKLLKKVKQETSSVSSNADNSSTQLNVKDAVINKSAISTSNTLPPISPTTLVLTEKLKAKPISGNQNHIESKNLPSRSNSTVTNISNISCTKASIGTTTSTSPTKAIATELPSQITAAWTETSASNKNNINEATSDTQSKVIEQALPSKPLKPIIVLFRSKDKEKDSHHIQRCSSTSAATNDLNRTKRVCFKLPSDYRHRSSSESESEPKSESESSNQRSTGAAGNAATSTQNEDDSDDVVDEDKNKAKANVDVSRSRKRKPSSTDGSVNVPPRKRKKRKVRYSLKRRQSKKRRTGSGSRSQRQQQQTQSKIESKSEEESKTSVPKMKLLLAKASARVTTKQKESPNENQTQVKKFFTKKGKQQFKCPQCGNMCTGRSALIEHIRIHTGEKPNKCSLCRMAFNFKHSLKRHKLVPHAHRCPHCPLQFIYSRHCKNHDLLVHQNRQRQNSKIQKQSVFMEMEEKVIPVASVKPFSPLLTETEITSNSTSNSNTKIQSTFLTRFKFNYTPKPASYRCRHCFEQFNKHSERLRHEEQMHDGKLPGLKCKYCGKVFEKNHLLIVHERKHTGEKPYPCMYCEASFSISSNRLTHMRKHHPADIETISKSKDLKDSGTSPNTKKLHYCSTCKIGFVNVQMLFAHKLMHRNEHRYNCPYCPKSFRSSSVLIGHKRTHTGERPFSCKFCHLKFGHSSSHRRHERTQHGSHVQETEVKTAGVSSGTTAMTEFQSKILCPNQIKIHLQRVNNSWNTLLASLKKRSERPIRPGTSKERGSKTGVTKFGPLPRIKKNANGKYNCRFCNKEFKESNHIVVHERIHTGERPFVCPYIECAKGFTQSHTLKDHIRTHTGERPFLCLLCGRRFTRKPSLNGHMKCVHRLSQGEKISKTNSVITLSSEEIKKVPIPVPVVVPLEEILPVDKTPVLAISSSVSASKTTALEHIEVRNDNDHIDVMKEMRSSPSKLKTKIPSPNKSSCTAKIESHNTFRKNFKYKTSSTSTTSINNNLPSCIEQGLNVHVLQYICKICERRFSYRTDAVKHAGQAHPSSA